MDWCCKIIKKNRKGAFHRVSMCFTGRHFALIDGLAISFNVTVKHFETRFVCQFGRRHVPLPSVLKVNKTNWLAPCSFVAMMREQFLEECTYNKKGNDNHDGCVRELAATGSSGRKQSYVSPKRSCIQGKPHMKSTNLTAIAGKLG